MMRLMRVWPGAPYPLGATWDGGGINFALFSENASRAELCLFDSADATAESLRIDMPERTDQVFHAYCPICCRGSCTGIACTGRTIRTPATGSIRPRWCSIPTARPWGRTTRWGDELFGYPIGAREQDLIPDGRNSSAFAPLAEVVQSAFPWGDDRPLRTPWHKTLIYEAHVKGMTRRHPDVPEPLRGTYLGMASEPVIDHLTSLGVTAVELLPVHHHVNDRHLVDQGLTNYWGYSTLSFFAPDARLAARCAIPAVMQFKTMGAEPAPRRHRGDPGRGLQPHRRGQPPGPDAVDARGGQLRLLPAVAGGRALLHGLHRLRQHPEHAHPRVLQLIMDSLRYWVLEMHVDGFRFDLASTLARELYDVDKLGAFFDIIHQDPVLSQVKLIAEPWDVGPGGYQVGNFPVLWTEWNGKYRDSVRPVLEGRWRDGVGVRLATCGQQRPLRTSGRRPYASINFVTCHDGFTLRDWSATTTSTTTPTARATATAPTTT
jgi:glycogen operon protein